METPEQAVPTPETTSQPEQQPQQARKGMSKKQLVIIGCVLVILILAVGVVLLLPKKSSHVPQTTQETTKVQKQQKKIPLASAVSSKWYTIKTQYYTVSVPEGWKPKGESMRGGVSMVLRPADTEEDPILVVEAYTVPVSIQTKINLFRAMGLKEQTVTVPNSQPVMLSGTWPTRTIDSKTFKMPTQERVVYIPHGNSLYGVKLYYSSPKPEKVYDDMLQKVLESFVSAS